LEEHRAGVAVAVASLGEIRLAVIRPEVTRLAATHRVEAVRPAAMIRRRDEMTLPHVEKSLRGETTPHVKSIVRLPAATIRLREETMLRRVVKTVLRETTTAPAET
jgi:hypothetical protein